MSESFEEIEALAKKEASKGFSTWQNFFEKLRQEHESPIGSGRNRVVFRHSEGVVIKAPKNKAGVYDNFLEWNLFLNASRIKILGTPDYAKCFKIEYILNVPCLIMEYVTPWSEVPKEAKATVKIPGWVKLVDRQQVGLNRSHKLVAYDYADLKMLEFTLPF